MQLLFYLQKYSRFRMESMAYIHESSSLEGSMLSVVGDLRMVQKQPLNHRGVDARFNVSYFLSLILSIIQNIHGVYQMLIFCRVP